MNTILEKANNMKSSILRNLPHVIWDDNAK